MAKNGESLSSWRAVWNAFWSTDIEHFPRLTESRSTVSLTSEQILMEIAAETEKLIDTTSGSEIDKSSSGIQPPSEILKAALQRGRESLDEVKDLTEYQDQKAFRLLIIATFLSALSGVLFARFNEAYPLPSMNMLLSYKGFLIGLTYLVFAIFLVSAVSGALVIFHATRTRFKFPTTDPNNLQRELAEPKSHLFFPAIIAVRPSAWAASFVTAAPTSDSVHLRPDLSIRYLRNYLGESYLVAAKVADKVRYLEPAQNTLAFGLRCLLVWLALLGLVNILVGPTPMEKSAQVVENVHPTGTGAEAVEPKPDSTNRSNEDPSATKPIQNDKVAPQ
ncbi:MAG: hypothetical protein EOS18_26840 [Mesorhizobium sp.]|nr:MAG: hypothetical protein EOS18_26840 [Mesorhizobium sp.]